MLRRALIIQGGRFQSTVDGLMGCRKQVNVRMAG